MKSARALLFASFGVVGLCLSAPTIFAQPLDIGYVPGLPPGTQTGPLAFQPDGKLLVAVNNYEPPETFLPANAVRLVRLNADGSFDATFPYLTNSGSGSRFISSLATDTNGAIFVAGSFSVPGSSPHDSLVKLLPSGVVDESFSASVGFVSILDLLALSDGKIMVAGDFTTLNGTTVPGLARLESDGSLDTNFWAQPMQGLNGVRTFYCSIPCPLPNGKLLLFVLFQTTTENHRKVVRLNADGSRDLSFTPIDFYPPIPGGESPRPNVTTIVLQEDGKLLMTGKFTGSQGLFRTNIMRFDPNGVPDETFLAALKQHPDESVWNVILLPGGEMLIHGAPMQFENYTNSVARLNSNGVLNTEAQPAVVGPLDRSARELVRDSAGRVYPGGNFNTVDGISRPGLARLLAASAPGTIQFVSTNVIVAEETSGVALTVTRVGGNAGAVSVKFATGGGNAMADSDYLSSTGLVMYADGESGLKSFTVSVLDDALVEGTEAFNVMLFSPSNFVTLGNPATAQVTIMANDYAGNVDATFRPGNTIGSGVNKIVLQPDGKVLVGGPSIRRLHPDGSHDTNFNVVLDTYGTVLAVALQADGRIVIGGDFDLVNGVAVRNLARLNTNGSFDGTFAGPALPAVPPSFIRSLGLQSDGKIIVGAIYRDYYNDPHTNIVRLHTNGILDSSFNVSIGPVVWGAWIPDVVVDAQDRIYLGGYFPSVNGVTREGLARLLPNGAVDLTFVPMNDLYPNEILPLANGQVLVCGIFENFGPMNLKGLARLHADGSLDESFVPPPGRFNLGTLAVQPDGKVIAGGVFDGMPNDALLRLNIDGSPDPTFRTVTTIGEYDEFGSIVVQNDGGILVGGAFTFLDGVERHNIARLVADVRPALRVDSMGSLQTKLTWPMALSNAVLECATDLPATEWLVVTGTPVQVGSDLVLTNTTSSGRQFYRLRAP